MIQLFAGLRPTIRRFRGLLLTGVALALGAALGTEEVQAQFVGQDFTSGTAKGATATGSTAVAVGGFAHAGPDHTTALGYYASAGAEASTAIGYLANASGEYSTALGFLASAQYPGSTALGSGSTTTRDSQMMFGNGNYIYNIPGLTSAKSLAAQYGSGQFVTSDEFGNLALNTTTTGRVGVGTFSPDVNSRMDIRSSTLINGMLMKRTDPGPHYLRVENSSNSIFRCGVQGDGDTQFGALTPGRGLSLVTSGAGKFAINAAGQLSFGSSIPPNPSGHAVIHSSGAFLTTGGTWTNASSRALKQDIEPITSAEAREAVRALQPVGYRYKSELDERYVGFIAEDVPELVATHDRKGLGSMDITAVLTKVVQDQDRELSDARQMIAELNERLLKLEQKLGDTPKVKPME